MEQLVIQALNDIGLSTLKLAEYFAVAFAIKFYIDKRFSEHKQCCTKVDPLLFNVSIKSIQDVLKTMQDSLSILLNRGVEK